MITKYPSRNWNYYNIYVSVLTSSMMKNITAQRTDPGRFSTKSGYVTKTSPGPEATTLSIEVSCTWAMYPRIENTKTPAIKHVAVLTIQVIMASLEKGN